MKSRPNKLRKEGVSRFSCPFCACNIVVAAHAMVDGGSVTCPYCYEESTLLRERIEHSGNDKWSLIVPLYEDEFL
jgi:hypothetical protein